MFVVQFIFILFLCITGLQEHYGSVKFAVKTERWMAYNLWRIVSKRELDKYVDAIEILQQLHSKWPKLITFEEYRRILLEMKTKVCLIKFISVQQ